MPSFNALTLAHSFLSSHVKPGDLCIDATAGRGRDTVFLCRLVGDRGRVLAYDIQKDAVHETAALLEKEHLSHIGQVFQKSHDRMAEDAKPGTVRAIVFNFGWLPGGDHNIFTRAQTSIRAIEQGLKLLAPDGVMSLSIYYGKENGTDERDALLFYLSSIDPKTATVLVGNFVNRKNNPAIPAFILKGV